MSEDFKKQFEDKIRKEACKFFFDHLYNLGYHQDKIDEAVVSSFKEIWEFVKRRVSQITEDDIIEAANDIEIDVDFSKGEQGGYEAGIKFLKDLEDTMFEQFLENLDNDFDLIKDDTTDDLLKKIESYFRYTK